MDLTYAPPIRARARVTPTARYVGALAVCLLGYAFFGRTFAYLGVPPLFIGEVLLVAGLVTAVRYGRLGAALSTWPLRLWAVLFVWALARTVPYLGAYGLDGPRDAMLLGYGLFAVVVAAVLLADPDRLAQLVRGYRTLAVVMLAGAWLYYLIAKGLGSTDPSLPWAENVGLFSVKGGDMMVHMTGVVAFLMLGGLRSGPLAVTMAAFGSALIMVSNRGGMVAFAIGLAAAWVLRPAGTGMGRMAYAYAALLLVGLLVAPLVTFEVQGGTRDVSVEQLVDNVKSVFVSSGSDTLDGTKRWRLLWWGKIVDYTFGGPYFWTGKGFGINLTISDGFGVGDDGLRSPHNGHLTVLARAGVPGLLLWLGLHAAWAASVLGAWFRARARDHRRWMALYAWLVAFWLAALVNGSFDVYLEGPMGGIWLWSVMGAGIAAVALHRTHPHVLDAVDLPYAPTPADAADRPARPFHW